MGIFLSGAAVCGPASVTNAIRPLQGLRANYFLEVSQLTGCTADIQAFIPIENGYSGRIISAVFQPA
jgi:hypothetical protein